MRRCPAEGTLRGYFDGELSAGECAEVTAHLASCEACARAAREMEEGIETLRQAFAPLNSLPVPASRLKSRLDSAINTMSPPKSGLADTARYELSALVTSLSQVSNRMPRFAQAFAGLLITLLLFSVALMYQSRPGVNEQAKNEIVPAVSSDPGARTEQKEVGGSEAPVGGSLSDRAQALSSDMRSPSSVTVSKVSLKSTRNAGHAATRGKSYNERRKFSPSLDDSKSLIPGEQKQLEQIATLTASLESGDRPLNPILRVEYERNVAVVDVAIKSIRRAALSNPRDKNAAGFLHAAYQSKISLLRAVALHADPPASLLED
jgi:hypothetical protein